jgi:hypothetical protein
VLLGIGDAVVVARAEGLVTWSAVGALDIVDVGRLDGSEAR